MGLYEDAQARQAQQRQESVNRNQQNLDANPAPQNPYQGGGQFIQSPYLNAYMQQNLANQNAQYNYNAANGSLTGASQARQGDRLLGRQAGMDVFYNDPDMMALRDKYIDQSKGYAGNELGALRSEARNQIAGNRNAYMSSLAGKTARAGVGGARAAAISAAADKGFNQNVASDERKALLDNAQLMRQGTKDFSEFAMKQKYGVLASELGEAGLGSNERGADAARNANKGGSTGLLSWLGL